MRALLLGLLLAAGAPCAAADKPVYKWNAANEFYFVLPGPQTVYYQGAGATETVRPWGFGLRGVGAGERFSRTGALQYRTARTSGGDSFWLLDLLAGLEYLTPAGAGPLRYSAAALADLGLSDTTLYAAPVLGAGLLYVTDREAATPTGLTLGVFWRPLRVDIDNAGAGRDAELRPALWFKLGYLFEGFWSLKEK